MGGHQSTVGDGVVKCWVAAECGTAPFFAQTDPNWWTTLEPDEPHGVSVVEECFFQRSPPVLRIRDTLVGRSFTQLLSA